MIYTVAHMQHGEGRVMLAERPEWPTLREGHVTGSQHHQLSTAELLRLYDLRMRNTQGDASGDWATLVMTCRAAARMSQKTLAERAEVARETIWRWETGKQVPENVDTVKLVAAALGVDLDQALAAAGLHPGQAPAVDPRLRGFAPNDPVVQKIMSLDVDEDMRDMMLERHRENLDLQQRRWLEDLERDIRRRGAA